MIENIVLLEKLFHPNVIVSELSLFLAVKTNLLLFIRKVLKKNIL